MANRRIDGVALGSVAVGTILVYAGIKGKSIPSAAQAIIQGKSPGSATSVNPIQQVVEPGGSVALGNFGSATGDALASWALAQVGHWTYVFGGKPAYGTVDCSSLANWGYGHVFGLQIPWPGPNPYDGTTHGPPTMAWFASTVCVTIGTDPSLALPGDLAIWDIHHMGICIGPDQMVSAQNPTDGVQQSRITGFSSGAFAIRRHKGLISTGTSQAPGTTTAGGRG